MLVKVCNIWQFCTQWKIGNFKRLLRIEYLSHFVWPLSLPGVVTSFKTVILQNYYANVSNMHHACRKICRTKSTFVTQLWYAISLGKVKQKEPSFLWWNWLKTKTFSNLRIFVHSAFLIFVEEVKHGIFCFISVHDEYNCISFSYSCGNLIKYVF